MGEGCIYHLSRLICIFAKELPLRLFQKPVKEVSSYGTTPGTSPWSLWARVLRRGCECACMTCLLDTVLLGQNKNKKESRKEPHGLQDPHGLQEIQKNYVQDSGSTETREKQKENKNENKRNKISRSADKVQWDKKKNKRTLISACGCKGWLWLWLWLSFAVPVFFKRCSTSWWRSTSWSTTGHVWHVLPTWPLKGPLGAVGLENAMGGWSFWAAAAAAT